MTRNTKKTNTVAVWLPDIIFRRAEAAAEDRTLTVEEYIRLLVEWHAPLATTPRPNPVTP